MLTHAHKHCPYIVRGDLVVLARQPTCPHCCLALATARRQDRWINVSWSIAVGAIALLTIIAAALSAKG